MVAKIGQKMKMLTKIVRNTSLIERLDQVVPGLFGENTETEDSDKMTFRNLSLGASEFSYSQLRQRCFSHFHPPPKHYLVFANNTLINYQNSIFDSDILEYFQNAKLKNEFIMINMKFVQPQDFNSYQLKTQLV